MGDVFEAEQESPRRRVAIKLMRSGLQSETMLRRFRREIEFLGRLSHPGVAQVYEAGVTNVGGVRVPYCVMEYVDGIPLTAYAKERGLNVEAKLRLFAAICDVVQYAHQQGVIHRDLKPANILIQERGTAGSGEKSLTGTGAAWGVGVGEAMPRILDFGIARAVDVDGGGGGGGGMGGVPGGASRGATLATEVGQIIGTVAYMSPEQIAGRGTEVDTRTDVYALGVILFELLTGTLPHRTDGMALLEAARVKQEEPSRLSTADRSLRGDLETIASKALEVEKGRRYASASELGMDVRRYLASEVIAARPATVIYQLRKFAGRNRGLVALGAVAVLALVGGLVATVVQNRIAVRERDVAVRKTEVAEAVSNVLLEALTVATPKGALGKEPRPAAHCGVRHGHGAGGGRAAWPSRHPVAPRRCLCRRHRGTSKLFKCWQSMP
jgi:serine/threonine protein kinase